MSTTDPTLSNESPSQTADKLPSQFDIDALVESVVEKGLPLYIARGLDESHLEALYAQGYAHYSGGRYEQAEKIFLSLCVYAHLTEKHWHALGSAQLLLKKYREAAYAFSYCAILNPQSPVPPFFAIECQLALGNDAVALNACEAAIFFSENKPEFEEINKKAKSYKELLSNPVEE